MRTANTDVRLDEDGHDLGTYDNITGRRLLHPVVQLTEVETGRRTTLPGTGLTYGWTPDGRLLKVSGSIVTTCDATTTSCTSRTMPTGPGTIRLAGVYNGS